MASFNVQNKSKCNFSLATGNEQNIQLVIYVAERLLSYFQLIGSQGCKPVKGALAVNDFLFAAGIDSVNMFHLLRRVKTYATCRQAKLAKYCIRTHSKCTGSSPPIS